MDKKDLTLFKVKNRKLYDDITYEYTSRIKKAYSRILEQLSYKEKMNINVTREKEAIKKFILFIQEELLK